MFIVCRTVGVLTKKLGENASTNGLRQFSAFKLQTPRYKNVRVCYKRYCTTGTGEESNMNFEEITQGDKELEHKVKILALEAEVMRQDGKMVPENSFLKTEHWQELLRMHSRSARQKYLEFLFKLSKKEEHRKIKAKERKKNYEEYLVRREEEKAKKSEESLEEFATTYGLQHNNIFLRFYDTTINQMYNNRLIQAMKFGQKLVVDVGYEAHMTKRENLNTAKQLMLLFAENRAHDDPFDMHFCNANFGGELMRQFYKFVPTSKEAWFPLNIHECSYTDLFPKDQLVYLTPHCREELKEFDQDAVYIIGAIVDKINQEPLSLAKAKREGLRMAKFPLDRYLQWGAGSGKSLTLNQVAAILLDQKVKGDWNYSLRHVPKRKLLTEDSTMKAMDRAYSRKKETTEKRRWSPTYNKVNFDELSYNQNAPKSRKNELSYSQNAPRSRKNQEKKVNVKNIFDD